MQKRIHSKLPGTFILFLIATIFAATAYSQAPIIFPGSVVNAASYTTGGPTGNGIAPGSLAVMYGINLAEDTLTPDPLLLTTHLGGATVTVGGVAAYLHYVSPGYLIFEMPIAVSGPTTLTVSTAAGITPPYLINAVDAFGVFTLGAGGCGPADALNPDGSLNSQSNSVSPGDFLAIFGTGLFPIDPLPIDGRPATSNPLGKYTDAIGGTTFDLDGPFSAHDFAGLTPGWVGLDQINVKVPDAAREGCAVPLLISTGASGNAKPVTVSIHKGGGQCSDPPRAGYGKFEWKKTSVTGAGPDIQIEEVTLSLQASPGKIRPSATKFSKGGSPVTRDQNFGPACPVPGYLSLDAGIVTVQGPGLGPTQAVISQFSPPEGTQVTGLTEYRADLTRGTMKPGLFSITASGGVDVTAFRTSLQIGAGIDITTPLPPGTIVDRRMPLVLRWSSQDSDALVTMKLVTHHGSYDEYLMIQARALEEFIEISPGDLAGIPIGPIEIDVEVAQANVAPLVVSGLSLGGEHTWRYVYRFTGLRFQ